MSLGREEGNTCTNPTIFIKKAVLVDNYAYLYMVFLLPHWRRQNQTLILLSTEFLSARQPEVLLDPESPEGTSRRPKHISEKFGETLPQKFQESINLDGRGSVQA